MGHDEERRVVRGYCPQCKAMCPTIAVIERGLFTKVLPDWNHPNSSKLCPKGLAGPELVYSKSRLRFPMRRTRPKGNTDAGWQRISWDEALDQIADRLNRLKGEFGAESVAFYRPSNGGSASKDWVPWFQRLAHAFGSPNIVFTTHICNWHKDIASAYTYGVGIPDPEFEKSGCILIWGHNPHNTWPTHVRDIERGLRNGAKLVVIDPRRTELAERADLWLQVHPGNDLALALSMIHVMIGEKLYDKDFVMHWTNAPFLVRTDTGKLLRPGDIGFSSQTNAFLVWDESSGTAKRYNPETLSFETNSVSPALYGKYKFLVENGVEVECKPVFELLREIVSQFSPESTTSMTRLRPEIIREAVRMFTSAKHLSYYTYNGVEQQTNSTQTNRAICILYSMTGDFDTTGGNRVLPRLSVRPVAGYDLLTDEIERKRVGAIERPLGPPGTEQRLKHIRSIRANDFYEAVLTGNPYSFKGLVAFGGNLVTSNPQSQRGFEAISALDFFVQAEMFMTPPCELADIVLPAASYWESWHARAGFEHSARANCHLQLREAVVPPQHDSKPDMEVIFSIAQRLGLGEHFWGGDIEAGFNYWLSPLGVTVSDLRKHPGGITIEIAQTERAYLKTEENKRIPKGFNTPSRKIEIYSPLLKDYGYEPLPVYEESKLKRLYEENLIKARYPLTLTNFKLLEYCHGWGRCLPSLRRRAPEPYVEINPATGTDLDVEDNELVSLETPTGAVRMKSRLTDSVPSGVVATQHGWWQGCDELGLPGYDPCSPEGANINLLYETKVWDSLSGAYPIKGYPCTIKKISF